MSRTRFNSAELVRLLAELTPAAVPEATDTLAERLGQWLGWTDAIALSSALHVADVAAVPPPGRPVAPWAAEQRAAQRVHQGLARAVAADPLWAPQGPRATNWADDAQDPLAYRRQYRGHQQAMVQALGPLRARLREALAGRSAALARLAALDGVLEQALTARERQLLATVPELLAQHAQTLRRAEGAAVVAGSQAMADAAPATAGPAWVATMGRLVPAVLLAELELRWQPIEGMLEALANEEEPVCLDE